ncbi:crotonase/enoyl-CoA hydratase family protein [Marinobacter sp. BGYM27]|uniref:crotonase/enoyl-CoA hydratase family protein n=1 Tax=unclassified Marinobacter TaxID=83889 RepID=UPI0021A959D7|nr:crotonase/enoyl-CoA hydratase family protein [Marinobacter sp. BGYM27]MDG5500920.1 crotonase/enoyl-CoA hydratase family protein [Marinobacter sp. BGYM27]
MEQAAVITRTQGPVVTITLNRPDKRNAVDGPTAQALLEAFKQFETDDTLKAAVLCGAGGHFCGGADLSALPDPERRNTVEPDGTAHGPMGPTRMAFSKPVIAAVSGYAVAGGLELALMCDLRVVEQSSTFGVFCRRWGVPLIDGGTVRLPRIVGHGVAMDMILTGRPVAADEALRIGLANRVVADGTALEAAEALAHEIAGFPFQCVQADRQSAINQWDLPLDKALQAEGAGGYPVIFAEAIDGARQFAAGAGRHGVFDSAEPFSEQTPHSPNRN